MKRSRELSHAYNNKCLLLIDIRNFDEARKVIEESIRISKQNHLRYEEGIGYVTLGDLEMQTRNHTQAELLYDSAYSLSEHIKSKEFLRIVVEHQIRFYDITGDYKKAFEKFNQYAQLKDDLFHEQLGSKIAELEMKFETEKKEREKASAMAMAVTANHEINQPLMVIKGNLDLLQMDDIIGSFSEKQRGYIRKIEDSIQRISEILNKFKNKLPSRFEEYSNETEMVVYDEHQE